MLDPQVLLDPFEEQFDLPAALKGKPSWSGAVTRLLRAKSATRRPTTAGVAAQAMQQDKRWLDTALAQLQVTNVGAEKRDRLGRRRHWRRPIAAFGGGGVAARVSSGWRKRWRDHRRSLAGRPLAHLPAVAGLAPTTSRMLSCTWLAERQRVRLDKPG